MGTTELPELRHVQYDVEIDVETWEKIQQNAVERIEREPDVDRATAYWDAVHEYLELIPNIHVDGEVKGPIDIPGVSVEDLGVDDE